MFSENELASLPELAQEAPRGFEFPLQGNDLEEMRSSDTMLTFWVPSRL
ncbi:hypothetical protein M5G07_06435 [Serratia symbiotica]|nr:hypothetical protein [Serratia symbiotica]